MKKLWPLLLAVLLLAGCRGMHPDEYISVQEHEAPFAVRETVPETIQAETNPAKTINTITRASDLRNAIQRMVEEGQETGRFFVRSYYGELDEDLENMPGVLLKDSPKHSYAIESLELSKSQNQIETIVDVSMKLRLSPQELNAIETRMYPEPALRDIYGALRQQLSSFMIQISGNREKDFVTLLEDYALHHPDQIIEIPTISCTVFPEDGSLQLIDLRFDYKTGRDALRTQREEVQAFLELTYKQLSNAQSAQQLLDALYKNLIPSFDYQNDPEATVYTQLITKVGSSRTMASVAEYLCNRAGESCQIVVGKLDGELWYWNRILSENRWYYFDLHTAGLLGVPPVLRPAEEMYGYSWDRTRYPEPEEPAPPSTESPTETTEPETADTAESA